MEFIQMNKALLLAGAACVLCLSTPAKAQQMFGHESSRISVPTISSPVLTSKRPAIFLKKTTTAVPSTLVPVWANMPVWKLTIR